MNPEENTIEEIVNTLKEIRGPWIKLPIWEVFANDIAFHNRFLPSKIKEDVNAFLDHLLQKDTMLFSIRAGTSLYRSRKITREKIRKDTEGNYIGFPKEESGMPPYRKAPYGRIGTSGIPVLYTANDIKTSCAELRPTKGEYISVAEFEVKEDIMLANFSLDQIDAISGTPQGVFFLNEMFTSFSTPVSSEYIDYLPSEYISEYIRKMYKNLHGIRYSSLHNIGGHNIALFEDSCCEFKRSFVVECTYLDYEFQTIGDGEII